ncbi:MAG: hypothetical protein ACJAV7_001377 [Flavobacteriales bacterium]
MHLFRPLDSAVFCTKLLGVLGLIQASMKVKLLIAIFAFAASLSAQTVNNGTFTSEGTDWGCSPETNPASTYGGADSDRVAEVDASAGLCQTISGFGIGNVYAITFDCSRRTTCGPATQTLDFGIDGGALATTSISRTGAFNFTEEYFTFTAKATSHTIDFEGTVVGTCGLIIDNVDIRLLSMLPIELLNFDAIELVNKSVLLEWQTASETNNDYFTIERSKDAFEWEGLTNIEGAGNSTTWRSYSSHDSEPHFGESYYRLKQTDFDGQFSYSDITHIELSGMEDTRVAIFPNPTTNVISIKGDEYEIDEISIFNSLGEDVTPVAAIERQELDKETVVIVLSELTKGLYLVKTRNTANKVYKK